MTVPSKVLHFLDPLGAWDPSLAFVMAGAIAVYAFAYRLISRRSAPIAAPTFSTPPPTRIDPKLIVGSLVFGVGWGLSGYCPGPSLISLSSAALPVTLFVLAMAIGTTAGMLLEQL
jgi:hypothetical protein